MKTTLYFYPNTTKKSKKNGKVPMYARIITKGQKTEKRLNIEVPEADLKKWDEMNRRFVGKIPANIALNKIETLFEDFKHNNATSLGKYNARDIMDIILGIESKPDPTALEFVDKFFQNAIIRNTEYAKTTVKGYRKAINHFRTFLNYTNSEGITLSKVNYALASDFKDYLLGNFPEIDKKSMTEPSALSNVKRLRTIFDQAVNKELLGSNPFKRIKLKSQSPRRARLDIHQVRKIYTIDSTQFPTQKLYKDLFLFSVFTGLAYIDAMSLKKTDLNVTANGEIRLLLKRKKTDIVTKMFLPKQAIEIIERYKQTKDALVHNLVLPVRSNKEINVQLKILANMVNIPIKLSTHIARHTYRQLLAEADITEMGVIKEMMGHTSRTDIDGTYYEVTETRLLEAKRKFEVYLDKHLSNGD